jgi:hypothetical protein
MNQYRIGFEGDLQSMYIIASAATEAEWQAAFANPMACDIYFPCGLSRNFGILPVALSGSLVADHLSSALCDAVVIPTLVLSAAQRGRNARMSAMSAKLERRMSQARADDG